MNVSVLMPRPFSQRHDAFISAFKAKRTSAVMGKDRVLIGLHRDGAAFPIHVKLSHVTQVRWRASMMS